MSFLGIVPFKKSQLRLSRTPLRREEGIFQAQVGRAWAIGVPWEDRRVPVRVSPSRDQERPKVTRAFHSPAHPGAPHGQAQPSLLGFRNREAVKKKIQQINNMAFQDPWTLKENHFEKDLQEIWFVFAFRRESNRDGEESRSAWRPGILSKLRRSERTCYLLEPDICCREMISSIKKPGHQLLLIQPSSQSELLTMLSGCTRHRAFTAQLRLLTPFDRTPQTIFSTGPPSVCVPAVLWLHSLPPVRALSRTEPPPSILLSQWKTGLGFTFWFRSCTPEEAARGKNNCKVNSSLSGKLTQLCYCKSYWVLRLGF